MALTILQEPTSPNVSSTNLIYTVSSSNVPQFQYRYIADLYESGSSTRLARFKYPQNGSGTANIDLGRPIGDYLETNYNWDISAPESSSLTANRFTIEFGEEYGTSYNSPVTTFPNVTSTSTTVLKGNIQYPAIDAYDTSTFAPIQAPSSVNWQNSAYAEETNVLPFTPNPMVYSDKKLTNNPNALVMPATSKYYKAGSMPYLAGSGTPFLITDPYTYATGGWFSAQPIGQNDIQTDHYLYVPNQLAAINNQLKYTIAVYNDSDTLLWTAGTNTTNFPSKEPTVVSIPIGPGNDLQDNSGNTFRDVITSSDQWNYFIVFLQSFPNAYNSTFINYYYNEDKGADYLTQLDNGSFTKPSLWAPGKYYPKNCNNEKTRFAFVNSFGVWDYYNVYMPTRRVTNIDRKTYEQERINLNDRIAQYNVSNRGELQYYTEYTDDFEITTDTIDSKESQWLREMFDSTEVYIQSGSNFIPINILNNQETIINSDARNKTYQYTIRYQFSNLREPR